MSAHNFDKILLFCNSVRKEFGKSPAKALKKGVPLDCLSCPIAETIGGVAAGYNYIVGREFCEIVYRPKIVIPKHVARFMRAFDEGKYPELVREAK